MNQQNLFSASSFNTPLKKELRTNIKKLLTAFALILILISSLTCKKSPNEPDSQDFFSFTFEDVSCTEAWFNIKIFNLEKPVIASVYVNDALNSTFNIISSDDTTFYVENLLPKKNYEVYVELISADKKFYRSNRLSFTTMDTTSHNFTFQSWEFGEGASSALYDVAIIDENNIWAVGEIYMRDSLGNYDPHAYNAVHWDGTKWELKRIFFPTVCGSYDLSSYPAKSIIAFDNGQIWISSSGDKIAILQDGIQKNKFCLPSHVSMSINKLWGSSSEDLYAVGNSGMIAHWDGKRWTKIESGTEIPINDIWGVWDSKNGKWLRICAVSSDAVLNPKLLKINDDFTVEEIPWPQNRAARSVWFKNRHLIYVCGSGIMRSIGNGEWKEIGGTNVIPARTERIRGIDLNDIFIVGHFGYIAHFNGLNFSVKQPKSFMIFYSCDYVNNVMVAVGEDGRKAYIAMMKRQ